MTIATEMIQAASAGASFLAAARLDKSVRKFLQGRRSADGGFVGRGGRSDLYYTVFALQSMAALGSAADDATARYVRSLEAGEGLDFVHLCCLARCWRLLGGTVPVAWRQELLKRLESHRAADGGYAQESGEGASSAYGSFLALAARQDLGSPPEGPERIAASLATLKQNDGGYANSVSIGVSSVPSTAAAAVSLRHLGRQADAEAGDYLLSCLQSDGGFSIATMLGVSDMLSTATALHALSACAVATARLPGRGAATIEFILALHGDDGGFRGSAGDDLSDCEYTFYALLALGHLANAQPA